MHILVDHTLWLQSLQAYDVDRVLLDALYYKFPNDIAV